MTILTTLLYLILIQTIISSQDLVPDTSPVSTSEETRCNIPISQIQTNLNYIALSGEVQIVSEDGFSNVLKMQKGKATLQGFEFNRYIKGVFLRFKLTQVQNQFTLFEFNTDNDRFSVYYASGKLYAKYRVVASDYIFEINKWYSVLLLLNNNNSRYIDLYINGSHIRSGPLDYAFQEKYYTRMQIGDLENEPGEFPFYGFIRDFQVFHDSNDDIFAISLESIQCISRDCMENCASCSNEYSCDSCKLTGNDPTKGCACTDNFYRDQKGICKNCQNADFNHCSSCYEEEKQYIWIDEKCRPQKCLQQNSLLKETTISGEIHYVEELNNFNITIHANNPQNIIFNETCIDFYLQNIGDNTLIEYTRIENAFNFNYTMEYVKKFCQVQQEDIQLKYICSTRFVAYFLNISIAETVTHFVIQYDQSIQADLKPNLSTYEQIINTGKENTNSTTLSPYAELKLMYSKNFVNDRPLNIPYLAGEELCIQFALTDSNLKSEFGVSFLKATISSETQTVEISPIEEQQKENGILNLVFQPSYMASDVILTVYGILQKKPTRLLSSDQSINGQENSPIIAEIVHIQYSNPQDSNVDQKKNLEKNLYEKEEEKEGEQSEDIKNILLLGSGVIIICLLVVIAALYIKKTRKSSKYKDKKEQHPQDDKTQNKNNQDCQNQSEIKEDPAKQVGLSKEQQENIIQNDQQKHIQQQQKNPSSSQFPNPIPHANQIQNQFVLSRPPLDAYPSISQEVQIPQPHPYGMPQSENKIFDQYQQIPYPITNVNQTQNQFVLSRQPLDVYPSISQEVQVSQAHHYVIPQSENSILVQNPQISHRQVEENQQNNYYQQQQQQQQQNIDYEEVEIINFDDD